MNLLIVHEHQLLADGLKVILGLNPSILSIQLLSIQQTSREYIQNLNPDVILIDSQHSFNQIAAYFNELLVLDIKPTLFILNVSNENLKQISPEIPNLKRVFKLEHGLNELLSELNSLILEIGEKPFLDTFINQKTLLKQNNVSEREVEIITLVMQGFSSQTIAEKLFLSVHTVNTHKRNIYRKLSVPNERELIKLIQQQYYIKQFPIF
ncbi:response regulator transcription factor [Flectobacillus longus]|uniref:response regulator transcription factor n=1 Tax=Flectobacillus longus TaxID=2984207 RepID=UPI0024B7AFA0|nr:LuxR C-terminal-related transcriptional regulator [Flectobacillus longus]MDI9882064.1 LuxR C-terminal-related transcriptional regulator [Flectobacillus longus]